MLRVAGMVACAGRNHFFTAGRLLKVPRGSRAGTVGSKAWERKVARVVSSSNGTALSSVEAEVRYLRSHNRSTTTE